MVKIISDVSIKESENFLTHLKNHMMRKAGLISLLFPFVSPATWFQLGYGCGVGYAKELVTTQSKLSFNFTVKKEFRATIKSENCVSVFRLGQIENQPPLMHYTHLRLLKVKTFGNLSD